MRKGFLGVDDSLNAGGLEEIAEIKRANPPAKSPMMKLFGEVMASKNQLPTPAMEGGPATDEALNLDSIGCTANVILMDHE